MPDIICPLYELPEYRDLLDNLAKQNIVIRPARPWDREPLTKFISERFGQNWVDETMLGLHHTPATALIALRDNKIIGFAGYEVTARGFFGPTGVDTSCRGLGVGKALFYEAMKGLRDLGYVYAIIGGAGPVDFYLKAMKGILLPTEWKTIYTNAMGATPIDKQTPKE